MTDKKPTTKKRAWVSPLAWVAGSFLFFFVLFFDPLGIHVADGWLQHAVGYHTGPVTGANAGGGVSHRGRSGHAAAHDEARGGGSG